MRQLRGRRTRPGGYALIAFLLALLMTAPTAALGDVTVEAEGMRLQSGRGVREASASGGRVVALSRGGMATATHASGAVERLSIFVRLHRCAARAGASAVVAARVDRVQVLRRHVRSSRWTRHSVRVRLAPGAHRFRVMVRRAPASKPGCMRPLRLDAIRLVDTASASPPAAVAPRPAPRAPRPTQPLTPRPTRPITPRPARPGTPRPRPPLTPPAGPPDVLGQPGLLFSGDYETGNLSQWSAIQRKERDRVQVVTSPVRDGRFAGRYEVRDGDVVVNGERAEVLWGSSLHPTLRDGEEHYIAWSTFFPDDSPEVPGRQLFMQTHPVGPGPPQIEMRWDGGRITLDLVNGEQPWSVPLVRGVWHDFVIHARWSADPAVGLVELWHDGEKVVSDLHTQTLQAPDLGSYVKVGYYRPGVHEQPPTWLFHDAMRVGTTLEAVMPSRPPAERVPEPRFR